MVSPRNPYDTSYAAIENQYVQSKTNPSYMLSTTPHLSNKQPGHSSSTSLGLYKRSFQGPFPSISDVDFTLQNETNNNLLVTAVPSKGGAKKTTKKKKSVPKKKKSVLKKKKSVPKKKKSVKLKKKSVPKKKKHVVVKKKKVSIKKKGGVKPFMSK